MVADLGDAWEEQSRWPVTHTNMLDVAATDLTLMVQGRSQDYLFRALDILSRYMRTKALEPGNVHAVTGACFLLACKVEGGAHPSAADVVQTWQPLDDSKEHKTAERMLVRRERDIVTALDWNLAGPSAYQWALLLLLDCGQGSPEVHKQCVHNLLTLFQHGLPFVQHSPMVCGEAAACAACEPTAREAALQRCRSPREELEQLVTGLLAFAEGQPSSLPLGDVPRDRQPCSQAPRSYDTANDPVQRLGRGAFGTVVSVKVAGRPLARKRIESSNNSLPATAVREAATLRFLGHSNAFIVALKDVQLSPLSRTQNKVYVDLLFPQAKGSLGDWMKDRDDMDEHCVFNIMFCILEGLAYAHSRGVVHSDIKPDNILWFEGDRFQLTDWGLATKDPLHSDRPWTQQGTLLYLAPEALVRYPRCCEAVDLWAAGLIMGDLVCHHSTLGLFFAASIVDHPEPEEILEGMVDVLGVQDLDHWPLLLLQHMQQLVPPFDAEKPSKLSKYLNNQKAFDFDSNCLQLLQALLDPNPSTRITAQQALEHPFFAQDEEPKPGNKRMRAPEEEHLKRAKMATSLLLQA